MKENKKTKVLLIDDDEAFARETAKLVNSIEGYTADYVTTPEKALKYLDKNQDTELVLLDYNLGPTLTGAEVLGQIKNKVKHIQVIMLTVQSEINICIECMKKGACDYMTKPFNKKKFLEIAPMALEKRKMSELAEKEKLSLIIGMADGIAHTINNRLTEFSMASSELVKEIGEIIENSSGPLQQNPKITESIESALTIANGISNNVVKTGNVIRGILNYARMKQSKDGASEVFTIEDIIDATLKIFKLKLGVEDFPIETSIASSDLIKSKKAILSESLLGILENAYEAIVEKETQLDKKEQASFKPNIKLTFTPGTSSYVIQVDDNGIGIKDEDKSKVFAPYFTTKVSSRSCIGSGMYVVKRMIEDELNGKILFDSQYMKGTTFFIEFPKG